METRSELVESLIEKAENYSKTTFQLTKLKALEKTIEVLTSIVGRLIVIVLVSIFVFMLSIGAAFLIGESLGKSYYGFFIVALFYFLGALMCHYFIRDWIKKHIGDLLITGVMEEEKMK